MQRQQQHIKLLAPLGDLDFEEAVSDGRIEYIENCINIIHAVYEKNDDKLDFAEGELEALIEKYLPEELKETKGEENE